ncbi:MAG: FhaA domain-containing protein [Dehalococcoidia bacterium]
MTDDGTTFIERFLERGARAVSGGIHPVELLQRVEDVAIRAVRDRVMPNQLVLTFNPDDFVSFEPLVPEFRSQLERMLDRVEAREGFSRLGPRLVYFEVSPAVPAGTPSVAARFADVAHRPSHSPAGQTQQLSLLQGAMLVTSDGARVDISHVPFTIGRASWNDLVLANMAVSRAHARIVLEAGKLHVEDLGSRNGIIVDGAASERAPLQPGTMVRIGDVYLWLEYRG